MSKPRNRTFVLTIIFRDIDGVTRRRILQYFEAQSYADCIKQYEALNFPQIVIGFIHRWEIYRIR